METLDEALRLRRDQLRQKIAALKELDWIGKEGKVSEDLAALSVAVENDSFTAVVLGEFSRGKSTFINALLGEPLLPMDVLPETAVIGALVYGERPEVFTVYRDGRRERGEATAEFLSEFSVRGSRVPQEVAYLHIKYPAPILEGNLVLVDTPGVSDLDEQQAEVTYGFLPQADCVIFLLDATAPLKKTERDFLVRRVLPQGIRRIIFVANKVDNLDEEDDEGFQRRLASRLRKAFGEECELFGISALQALRGRERGDTRLVAESGILPLEARLKALFSSSERESLRLGHLEARLTNILRELWRRAQSSLMLSKSNISSLLEKEAALDALIQARADDERKMHEYMEENRHRFLRMLEKSLQSFFERLTDDVEAQVRAYRGADFKDFVETRLERSVQKEISNWLALYVPRLDRMVQQVGEAMARGLSKRLAVQISPGFLPREWTGEQSYGVSLTADDISNTDVKAGALAAAGGIGLTMLVGSAFMPFVGFAAMPFLRRRMLEGRLRTAVEGLLPQLREQLASCQENMLRDVGERVARDCREAEERVRKSYAEVLESYRRKLDEQLARHRQSRKDVEKEAALWERRAEKLQQIMGGGQR